MRKSITKLLNKKELEELESLPFLLRHKICEMLSTMQSKKKKYR